MKRIIILGLLGTMLSPLSAFALINAPELLGGVCGNQKVSLSGNVVSATVKLDGSQVAEATGNWSAVADVKIGNHEVSTVGNPTESLGFNVRGCEGGGIIRNEPCFGIVSGHGLENCQAQYGNTKFEVVAPGVGDCPLWVSHGCNKPVKSDNDKLIESLQAQVKDLMAKIAILLASRR